MRLDRISIDDVVLPKVKGRSIYGEVLEITDGQVDFRPLCPGAWRHAIARGSVAHWLFFAHARYVMRRMREAVRGGPTTAHLAGAGRRGHRPRRSPGWRRSRDSQTSCEGTAYRSS